MLNEFPTYIKKWILSIPAIISLAAGMLTSSLIMSQRSLWPVKEPLLSQLILVAAGSYLITAFIIWCALKFGRAPKKMLGYSGTFWIVLLCVGYVAGITLGIIAS